MQSSLNPLKFRTKDMMAASLVAMAAALAPPASAAEAEAARADSAPPPTEVIVVSATRTPVLADKAPATVTVITEDDIADTLATDIKDLVRYEPGVSVRRAPARFGATIGSTGRARNEDFTIRGIGGNRVLIQVDGIRTPQGFSFGAQDAGRGGFSDVSLVKQVEILRGPASALYGSDGLAGAISFTTSDPADLLRNGADFGGFLRASYSSEDEEFAETAALAGRAGEFSLLAAYTRRDFKELDNQGKVGGIGEARTRPNPQDGSSDALLGKLVWERGDHRLRLTGEHLASEVFSDVLSGQGPAFLFGPFPAWNVDRLTANDEIERTRVSLDWTYDSEGTIDYAQLAAFWQDASDVQFASEERSPVPMGRPVADRTRLNTFANELYGISGEVRARFDTGAISHRLAIGGDVNVTRQNGLRDGEVPPIGEFFPQRPFPPTEFTQGGVFVANEISLFGGVLTLFPALRFDFYDLEPESDPLLPGFAPVGQSDSRLSPKLGATLELTDAVLLFGNYAQGFRAPTPSQVNNFFENLVFGYTSLPNAGLQPERSTSYEGGVRYKGGIFRASLVAFRGEYDGFINQEIVGGSGTAADPLVFQFVNLDEVVVEGLEAKASLTLDNGFYSRFAMAYATGEVRTPGAAARPLDTIDPYNFILGAGYREPDGRFGAELVLTHHARKAAEDAAGVCDTACFRPKASTVIDLTAFFEVTDALKLRGGIFNLTDQSYAHWSDVRGLEASSPVTQAFTRPGRNASISLSYSF